MLTNGPMSKGNLLNRHWAHGSLYNKKQICAFAWPLAACLRGSSSSPFFVIPLRRELWGVLSSGCTHSRTRRRRIPDTAILLSVPFSSVRSAFAGLWRLFFTGFAYRIRDRSCAYPNSAVQFSRRTVWTDLTYSICQRTFLFPNNLSTDPA